MNEPSGFVEKVYVTKPVLPPFAEFQKHMKDLWQSRILTNHGPWNQKLEAEVKNFLQAPHVSIFNNGTTALLAAIKCLELTGEVITTPFTFSGTVHSLQWQNIKPVFVDIDPCSLNMDPQQIEDKVTEKTSGILAVHTFGLPCDVEAIGQIAQRRSLKLIYDAAHAFGSQIKGQPISDHGDISMLSFHATKLFHTIEGGALISKNPTMKSKIDLLRNFGIDQEDSVVSLGINGKLSEIHALMGCLNLQSLSLEKDKRRKIKERYLGRLKLIDGIETLTQDNSNESSQQYFAIRVNKDFGASRDQLYGFLRSKNVHARRYFNPLCSEIKIYKDIKHRFPQAEKAAKEVLVLPFFGELSIESVDRICDMIFWFRNSHIYSKSVEL